MPQHPRSSYLGGSAAGSASSTPVASCRSLSSVTAVAEVDTSLPGAVAPLLRAGRTAEDRPAGPEQHQLAEETLRNASERSAT
ncbi:MAG TPA: hypothetical protein VHH34_22455 [Pseudonocardiaceae bacterium]|nr:hypothetical protein [Pseudonocardiaceae bacterium]